MKRLVIRKSDLENMKEIISDFVGEVKVCLPLKHTNIVVRPLALSAPLTRTRPLARAPLDRGPLD